VLKRKGLRGIIKAMASKNKKTTKICLFTGSRADWGALQPLARELFGCPEFETFLIVTGSHLCFDFGGTVSEIEGSGFPIAERIEILLNSDTRVAAAKAMGLAMISFSELFDRRRPNLTIVYGDRFEMLAAGLASAIMQVPIAHISGGETSEGCFDDAFRNSLTKLSTLHFAGTDEFSKRIIQMGENPDRVFCVGELGLSDLKTTKFLTRQEIEKAYGFEFLKKNLLITVHPETATQIDHESCLWKTLPALEELSDTRLVFTKANADPEGRKINDVISRFVSEHSNAVLLSSMGKKGYLSTVRLFNGVIGNSSSGIIEAPSLKVGTINIGDRQCGRLKGETIIDCAWGMEPLRAAVKLLFSEDFQKKLVDPVNPYYKGNSAKAILKVLKRTSFPIPAIKHFYTLENKVRIPPKKVTSQKRGARAPLRLAK